MFKHYGLAIKSTGGRGELYHRVLTADLIGKHRHVKMPRRSINNIEISHARLYHHHIGAFGNIERDLAQGFIAIPDVHLVAAFVRLA